MTLTSTINPDQSGPGINVNEGVHQTPKISRKGALPPDIRGDFNKCPDFFFVQAFKIVVYSWKFNILLLYILWDDWPIFMISGSNEHLQQQLEYTLLNPDCHS